MVTEEEAAEAVQMAAGSKINQVPILQILDIRYLMYNFTLLSVRKMQHFYKIKCWLITYYLTN